MPTVLLFKEEDKRYTTYLNDRGISTHSISPLSFKFVHSSTIEEALKAPDQFSGIILTSPRAAEGVADIYSKLKVPIHNQWREKKLFAMGYATSEIIETKSGLVSLSKNASNSQQLGAVILDQTEAFDKPLLFPCGNLRKEDLPKILASNDRDFRGITFYETHQSPGLEGDLKSYLGKNKPDFMVFFSPSGVNFVAPILKKNNISCCGINLVAIGTSTNIALVDQKLPVYAIAPQPSPEGVVTVIR